MVFAARKVYLCSLQSWHLWAFLIKHWNFLYLCLHFFNRSRHKIPLLLPNDENLLLVGCSVVFPPSPVNCCSISFKEGTGMTSAICPCPTIIQKSRTLTYFSATCIYISVFVLYKIHSVFLPMGTSLCVVLVRYCNVKVHERFKKLLCNCRFWSCWELLISIVSSISKIRKLFDENNTNSKYWIKFQ